MKKLLEIKLVVAVGRDWPTPEAAGDEVRWPDFIGTAGLRTEAPPPPPPLA